MKQNDLLVWREPWLQIHNILGLSRANANNLNYCEQA